MAIAAVFATCQKQDVQPEPAASTRVATPAKPGDEPSDTSGNEPSAEPGVKPRLNFDTKPGTMGYHRRGGMEGYERLTVTQDSIHYTFFCYRFHVEPDIEINKIIKTPEEIWQRLVSLCDTATFAKIQSGKTTAEFDGVDIYFTVATEKEELYIVNAVEDNNYRKIQPFLDVLSTEIRGLLLEEYFCTLANSGVVRHAIPVMNLFFVNLSRSSNPPYETLTDEDKLASFVSWLKAHDCITGAQIPCVSCMYSYPAQSSIYFTVGQSATHRIHILMSEPLRISRVSAIDPE